MNNNNLIYNLDSHIPFKHILIYGFQELLAVLVATILITSICGVPIGAGLIGAGLATITYNLITRGNSNVFISNSGAFVSPCLFAFAAGGGTAAMIGAFVIMIIYIIMGLIFSKIPMEKLYIYLPKTLIATITILIGLSLINPLARAILCFCPPDNLTPFSPTKVSYLSLNFLISDSISHSFAIF